MKHTLLFADITQVETPISSDIVLGPDALKEIDQVLFTLSKAVRPMEILILGEPRMTFKKFCKEVKPIHAGGGVVINKENKLLVMKRRGKWDFPKGKIEKDEGLEHGAIREVEEECNVFGLSIIQKLMTTYHVYRHKGKYVLKVSHWFEMHCDNYESAKPQLEEDIEEIKWVDPKKFELDIEESFPSILDVLAVYQHLISQ